MSTTEEHLAARPGRPDGSGTLDADRELLRDTLAARWRERRDPMDRICDYALIPAGKLLRPLLVLQSARAVGGAGLDPGDGPALAELALAIEYLHVATLVHDDIIDHDDTRRGRPSVQAAHGVPTAIIVGDGLLLETFAALAGSRPAGVPGSAVVAVVEVMAEAGRDLCRGQLLEVEFIGDLSCTAERYLTMAHLKTGVLFQSACRIGALLGGAPPRWVRALGEFGANLGAAFQIRDDLLGFDAAATATGKPRDSDVLNRRPTLPMLLAYQRADADRRRQLEKIFADPQARPDAFERVGEIVAATGALPAAAGYAQQAIDAAKRALRVLPGGESIAVLEGLADHAAGRLS
ncbi:MAG: polyprenyl synthetase family protein [Catenulispora sp.]